MITYKLIYTDKAEAMSDALLQSNDSIEAIVHVGRIVETEAIFDEEGNGVAPATLKAGYCVDVMSNKIIDFENIVFPKSPSHKFFEQ